MKTQLFPNWCKKLGLSLFFIAFLVNGSFNFFNSSSIQGIDIKGLIEISKNDGGFMRDFRGLFNAFTGGASAYVDVLAIIGMIIYLISKEKIEDDYNNKLRLETFQLTSIITLIAAMVIYIVSRDLKLTINYFILPFTWVYMILFFIKRKLYI